MAQPCVKRPTFCTQNNVPKNKACLGCSGRLLGDTGGLAHQVVEKIGVPLLGGDVAGVEKNGEAKGLQVLRVLAPVLVVKVHLERVVVVGGDAQYLGVQRSGRQTCAMRVNQKLYDNFIHF